MVFRTCDEGWRADGVCVCLSRYWWVLLAMAVLAMAGSGESK